MIYKFCNNPFIITYLVVLKVQMLYFTLGLWNLTNRKPAMKFFPKSLIFFLQSYLHNIHVPALNLFRYKNVRDIFQTK